MKSVTGIPENHLRYHGDQAAVKATLDFAVNVHAATPPLWLQEVIRAGVEKLGTYPESSLDEAARETVAVHHGVKPTQVMLLNGAAEGFALLARLDPRHPAVVHPGFTEPEACLTEAGFIVDRVVLAEPFALAGACIPEEADMVIIGNPTNPTGVLHSVAELAKLARPGRYLVVDEAFLDVTGGESIIAYLDKLPGLIVLRSLTKTWSIPGLRCGYLLSDQRTISVLSSGRGHWPLGTLQLYAIKAVLARGGDGERALPSIKADIAGNRSQMMTMLLAAGFRIYPSDAPYLLVQPPGDAEVIRGGLAKLGIAVRRCDTFPGLDLSFWRLAVRPPSQVADLLQAVAQVRKEKCLN